MEIFFYLIGFILCACIFLAWNSERSLIRVYQGQEILYSHGLVTSLKLAYEKLIQQNIQNKYSYIINKNIPHLYIFPNPLPCIQVVRALGGKGSILMSQGMIAMANEEEIQAVMSLAVIQLFSPRQNIRSFFLSMSCSLLQVMPQYWSERIYYGKSLNRNEENKMSMFQLLWFLILFPMIQFCLKQVTKNEVIDKNTAILMNLEKIVHLNEIWSYLHSVSCLSAHESFFDRNFGHVFDHKPSVIQNEQIEQMIEKQMT